MKWTLFYPPNLFERCDLLYEKNNWTESKVSPATESQNNALKPLRILSLRTTDCMFTLRSNMVYCLLYFRRGNSLFWVLQCVLHTCCFTHLNTPPPPLLLLQTSVTVTYLMLLPFTLFVHLCCVTFYNQSFFSLSSFVFVYVCLFMLPFTSPSPLFISLCYDLHLADCHPLSPASRHVVSHISRA